MTIHFTKQRSFRPSSDKLTQTSLFLAKALNGEIPTATLENIVLDQREVSLFLVRELMFWYSALFYELQKCLLASTKK
jgi:hypothetical protein